MKSLARMGQAWLAWWMVLGLVPVYAAAEDTLSAFRLLSGDGHSIVRVLTKGGVCPQLEVDGKSQPMVVRVGPRKTPRADQPGSVFPLQVCELSGIPATATVRLGGQELPHVPAVVRKIVVLGDTGCRTKWPGFYQSCNDAGQWPLAEVARHAAAEHPDAVIHVGDYAYRESPCTSGGCAGTPYGYGWDVWKADFFDPMAPLLAAAPWVMARGNHESCARAGQGWFRFIDPFPYDEAHACSTDHAGHEPPDPPYAVPVGEGLQWVVMDSTAASSERKPHEGDPIVKLYADQFGTVARLASAMPQNWLVMHHPLLGYGYLPLLGFQGANPLLVAAMAEQHAPSWAPPGVQMVLQGHIHTFELSSFDGAAPLGLIAGFGGSMLEPAFPSWVPGSQEVAPGVRLVKSVNDQHFGYLVLERAQDGHWNLTEKSPQGDVRRTCRLALEQVPADFHCETAVPPLSSLPALPPVAQRADYLLLGEVHDNAAGHALRQRWLEELAEKGGEYGLAFEQLQRDRQRDVTEQQNHGSLQETWDDAALMALARSGGFQFKGWHWEYYKPAFELAMGHRWSILATNLERGELMDFMTGKAHTPTLPRGIWTEQQQKTLLSEVKEGHCGLLPDDQLSSMVAAQMARDRSMAEALVSWHQRTGKPVILLAGNGHLRKDTAVPVWIHALDPEAKVVSVAILEPEAMKEASNSVVYDAYVEVVLQPREDPCIALRRRFRQRLQPKP